MITMGTNPTKVNLLNFNRQGLESYFQSLGEARFRAEQVLKWMHQYGVDDFAAMTNLSKSLRENLTEHAEIKGPDVVFEQVAKDGVCKWLLRLADGNCIETVYIPEAGRGTLCVSSQVGCILNCRFCSTAKQGFSRNLSVAEIIGQVWVAVRSLSLEDGRHDRRITNVVMMGMGEPLLNFDNVVAAMDIMLDDCAYGLAKKRVTLSTAGMVPEMYKLREVSGVALAVSLHAPNDELRSQIVPLNKKYPLAELMQCCRDYFRDETKRKVTFEYVMLAGVNDRPKHARELIKLIAGVPCKVNLIPFNPFPGAPYQCSDQVTIDAFRAMLLQAGVNTVTRKTRGDDIDAACGQLVGRVADKTSRQQRWSEQLKHVSV